jgi:Zn-dependent protease
MFFSLMEIVDIVIMAFAIGFIFKDVFKYAPKVEVFTPEYYIRKARFKWNDFWFAVAVVAPSIIIHEFGHKFVALAFGMEAVFHAAYTWLVIGLVLKLINFGFIFFVPAYTLISGGGTQLQMAVVAVAGPAVNLILWLGAKLVLGQQKKLKLSRLHQHLLFLVSRINMFLFIFNMLPIPGFDGLSFFSYIFKAIF